MKLETKLLLNKIKFFYKKFKERFSPALPFTKSQLQKVCDFKVNGSVVFIGAHQGQEVNQLLRWGFKKIYLFEPQEKFYKFLKKNFLSNKRIIIFNKALGNEIGEVEMYLENEESSNNSASSSLLKPREHKVDYPDVNFDKHRTTKVKISKLDNFQFTDPSILIMDTQGFEFEVLKGGEEFLKRSSLKYIILEYWQNEAYENVPSLHKLKEFLKNFSFVPKIQTYDRTFGDILFVRSL